MRPPSRWKTTSVGMSLGSTVSESSSRTLVDSADPGSHEDASLFWTSASLAEKPAMMTVMPRTTARTTHLLVRPVSDPAI